MKKTASLFAVFALGLLPWIPAQGEEGDFSRGAQAWVENCGRCHNVRDPKEFRDDLWRPIVYHMRIRGGLTGQETRDILKFLRESN